MEHLCSSESGSFGGPLFNLINFKVIGLHKGSKEDKNYNYGIFIRAPIEDFKSKYKFKKEQIKKNNNKNNNRKEIENDITNTFNKAENELH